MPCTEHVELLIPFIQSNLGNAHCVSINGSLLQQMESLLQEGEFSLKPRKQQCLQGSRAFAHTGLFLCSCLLEFCRGLKCVLRRRIRYFSSSVRFLLSSLQKKTLRSGSTTLFLSHFFGLLSQYIKDNSKISKPKLFQRHRSEY